MSKKSLTAIYRSASKVAANQHSIALGRRDSVTGKFIERSTSKSGSQTHGQSTPKPRG